MKASNRRVEIIRILTDRQQATVRELANELGVSVRTIHYDITYLSADYPLETIQGNGGCVKLANWYKPDKRTLSEAQKKVLQELIPLANTDQAETLNEILRDFS